LNNVLALLDVELADVTRFEIDLHFAREPLIGFTPPHPAELPEWIEVGVSTLLPGSEFGVCQAAQGGMLRTGFVTPDVGPAWIAAPKSETFQVRSVRIDF